MDDQGRSLVPGLLVALRIVQNAAACSEARAALELREGRFDRATQHTRDSATADAVARMIASRVDDERARAQMPETTAVVVEVDDTDPA